MQIYVFTVGSVYVLSMKRLSSGDGSTCSFFSVEFSEIGLYLGNLKLTWVELGRQVARTVIIPNLHPKESWDFNVYFCSFTLGEFSA